MAPDGFTGVLEPDEVYRQDNGLLIARTAGTVESGLTLVCVVNISEADLNLHENTPIGLFHAALDQKVKISRVDIYELVQSNTKGAEPVSLVRPQRVNVDLSLSVEQK